jgi:tripartite-type tricarboxylate transporter receptor subunit TctC
VITLVVPFGAGSGSDTTARILAQNLGPLLGQNVIIENRVGATGMVATNGVARAAPDGYTLLFATNSTHGSNPSLFKTVTYDPVKDFAPVGRLGAFGYFVVVNPQVPAQTIQELVAYAKANPDKLTYGSGSSTSHIMAETFKRGTGSVIMRVPYRSNPTALTDLVGGRISLMFADISSSVSFVKSKDLRALAVTSAQRSAIVPELPTLSESVLPGFDIESWTGILAPAGTPEPIIARLNGEMNKVLAMPDIKQRMFDLGVEPQPTTPAAFGAFVKDEVAKWGKLVKDAGIEPE